MLVKDIVQAIEEFAPATLQESWDNTGLLVGSETAECSGVMLCVDISPAIIDEAVEAGCNMVVSHHPLIFRGIKRLNGANRVERSVIKAIEKGVALYCCHTSVDKVAQGVSWEMAKRLDVKNIQVLSADAAGADSGLGVVGDFAAELSPAELVAKVKKAFNSPVARCSCPKTEKISRIAMCGGSGSEFLSQAIAAGAQAYLTSDTRYHDFVDYSDKIFVVDIGHFESEECTKQIFYQIITEKFPNFAVRYSVLETNPISYL